MGDRKAKPGKVLKLLAEHVPEVDELTKKFVASIVCSLVDCKCFEEAEWETSISAEGAGGGGVGGGGRGPGGLRLGRAGEIGGA